MYVLSGVGCHRLLNEYGEPPPHQGYITNHSHSLLRRPRCRSITSRNVAIPQHHHQGTLSCIIQRIGNSHSTLSDRATSIVVVLLGQPAYEHEDEGCGEHKPK